MLLTSSRFLRDEGLPKAEGGPDAKEEPAPCFSPLRPPGEGDFSVPFCRKKVYDSREGVSSLKKVSAETYKTLFFSTFRISACTFGGGFVIIPLLRKRFTEDLHWIEDQEMLDLTAIAQSSPGPIAVNASILIGYRVAGLPGALLTILGTVLPPLIIISIISLFYQAFRDNKYVSLAMAGMLAGVTAVILDVVCTLIGKILKPRRLLPLLVLAGAFVATYFFHVNIVWIILVCGLIGAGDTLRRKEKV